MIMSDRSNVMTNNDDKSTVRRNCAFHFLSLYWALLLSLASVIPSNDAFQPLRHSSPASSLTLSKTRLILKSSKDEEIAKLEEQLKKLKDEKAQQDELEVSPQNGTSFSGSAPGDEEDVSIGMFLSEGWKEKEISESGNNGGGGTLTTILGALALMFALVVFSQVPIGQEDLSKYSAIKAPTEQIDLGDLNRARNSIGDL